MATLNWVSKYNWKYFFCEMKHLKLIQGFEYVFPSLAVDRHDDPLTPGQSLTDSYL